MENCCCSCWSRQGHADNLLAGTKWQLPASAFVTSNRKSLSCAQGMFTAQRSLKARLSSPCSMGLDLLVLTVLWFTNSLICKDFMVRISTLPWPWVLCNYPAWCALFNVRSMTSLGGIIEGQMCGFNRFLFKLWGTSRQVHCKTLVLPRLTLQQLLQS